MNQKESTESPNLNNYILQDRIGSGSFGKVYKVKDKRTNEIYAAKISINAIDTDTQQLFTAISQEVNIISRLNHPSILKFILFSPINFKNKPKPVIITEYASSGSLLQLIEHDRVNPANHILDDTRKLIIIYGIASAMSYLHFNDILHRDLKPDNVLMDSFYPKIADFGLSKIFDEHIAVTRQIGTPIYMAPELINGDNYTNNVDVFAYSYVLYEIWTLRKAWSDKKKMKLFNLIDFINKGQRPVIRGDEIPEPYIDLIKKCWETDPKSRPTFVEIVKKFMENKEKYFNMSLINRKEFEAYIKSVTENLKLD